ncbi:MAG: nitrogenase iron-molybdenum cofactor biosynthesis protein NifE [Dactylosporangium sp.]|nr:nitrogenase iron-molybdenum cofactor biosynthesis protein NifE [Dactylosporangium sp.]
MSMAPGGCRIPRPGDTAGGCSFDGAMITLAPIADAAHLVHGPISCCGNSWDGRGSRSSGPAVYRHGFTTDLREQDLVLGGEGRLARAIVEVAARYHPAAIFVYATCVTAMTGDDLEPVCAAAARSTGIPVICVPAAGFVGTKNAGNKMAGQVLLDHVIGTAEPERRTRLDVALVGEYNIAGELWQVTPLLDRLGLRVLSCVTGDARYATIAATHRARATMVVCSRALLGLAKGLEERYGIPWFEGSFYGVRATGDSLRGFARLLADRDPDLPARTEALIAEQEALVDLALAPYRARLAGRRAVLYTGGVKSWSMVSALQDIGVTVVASGGTKSTPADIDRITGLLGDPNQVITEGQPARLLELIDETGADILIAGGRNQYTAVKARLPFVDVNQERQVAFAGYEGVVELARHVDLALSNPAWAAVRRPAPWDRVPCPTTPAAPEPAPIATATAPVGAG